MTPFLIYKASAGSGKTFTICKAFVKELICRDTAYRHILAVTFTNKATNEMKQRIIANLDGLARGQAGALRQALLDDFRQEQQAGRRLPEHIARWLSLTDDEARKAVATRAEALLQQILHDYGRLSIMTIDSFFQRIIRTFTLETGLRTTFELQLDNQPVMEEAVARFLTELQPGSASFEWFCGLMEERMQRGDSWNCQKTLVETGLQMLQETAQTIPEEDMRRLTDRDTLRAFRQQLLQAKKDFEEAMQHDAREALDIMQRHGLDVSSFKKGTRSFATHFDKVLQKKYEPTATVRQACDSPDQWTTKTRPNPMVMAAYAGGLNACLCRLVDRWDHERRNYFTACIILKRLSQMGFVADLDSALRRTCLEEDIFLNSQSNAWIQKIIDGADAPFIYERTGSHYRHFMIDEMQDTSHMQWSNLLPLLRNGLSQGATSWTVGDVKQAIYRFRNGDWHIMSRQMDRDIAGAGTVRLQYNYRSTPEVIGFNNAFFTRFTCLVADTFQEEQQKAEFRQIYADVCQQVPATQQRHGCVTMLFHPSGKNEEGTPWQEASLEALPEHIMQLEQKGFRPSDIAILVRRNSEAARIARFMLAWREEHPDEDGRYVFDMLYNEAMYIDDSGVVQWLTEALTYLVTPEEEINLEALRIHSRTVLGRDPEEMMQLLGTWAAASRGESVYQAATHLADVAGLYSCEDEAPFLQAFLDLLFSYCRTRQVDTGAFLAWWETHRHKEHLKMPETQDAIRLMSIHQSKGLEFGAVLMPFADWEMCRFYENDQAWLSTAGTPFDGVPLVPVPLRSSKIEESVFGPQFLEEKFMRYIDNVNLLYVAFTRARDVLLADMPMPEDPDSAAGRNSVASFIWQTCRAISPENGWETVSDTSGEDVCGWCSGRPEDVTPPSEPAAASSGPLLNSLYRPGHGVPAVTRLRPQTDGSGTSGSAAARGVVLHELFSRIRTLDTVPQLLEQLADEGLTDRRDSEELARFVHDACQDPEVQRWFSAGSTVRTEAGILLPDGTRLRPDRVVMTPGCTKVIDYKFGGQESAAHRHQVQEYMHTLREMGYPHVEGYLWYVSLGRIVRVA